MTNASHEQGGRAEDTVDGSDRALPTFYTDADSKHVGDLLERGTARRVDSPEGADLLWLRSRVRYKPLLGKLKPFQLLNHIPNEFAMADKGRLAETLYAYDRVHSDPDFGVKDLVQETYCLYLPEGRERFFAQLPESESRDDLWILKRCNLSEGYGIHVLWQFDELRRFCERAANPKPGEKYAPYVIQRYIKNPLLLAGRKSEIRIYWLVASIDPLLVLVYREGTVRLNTSPFKLDEFDNPLIHVTNVVQQKSHRDHDPSAVLKWSFKEWERYLIEDRKIAPNGFVEQQLKPQLKRMLTFVVRAAAPALAERLPENGLCFGLYGADVILDEDLHPWLTEVQEGPATGYDDPIKREVLPPMLMEAAAIMFEVARRKRDRASLKVLDAVSGFEWVLNDA